MASPIRTASALLLLLSTTACGEHPASTGITSAAEAATALTDPASGADCGGKDLHITRDDSRLVIHGQCGEVVISASNGSLNLDKARSIRVQGERFTVLNEEVETIEVSGNGNTLNLTDAGQVRIGGSENTVLGRTLRSVRFDGDRNSVNTSNSPALEDTGTGNRVI